MLLFIFSVLIFQQISLQFIDAETGQAVAGVEVRGPGFMNNPVISDASGWATISTNAVSIELTIFAYGYHTEIITIHSDSSSHHIKLERLAVSGTNIFVTDKKRDPGEYRISNRAIEELPTFLGQSDVLKNLQRLPTVTSGLEGSTDLFVKGGNRGQNLLFFHDIPLQKFFHAGGLLSSISTAAIGSAHFYSSHVPVELGNAVSSVLEIKPKETTEQNLLIEVGLLTAGISFEHKHIIAGFRTNTFNNSLDILDINETYTFPETQFQDGYVQTKWGSPSSRWYLTGIWTSDKEHTHSTFTAETEEYITTSTTVNDFGWQQAGASLSNRITTSNMVWNWGLVLTSLQQQTDWNITTKNVQTTVQDYSVSNGWNRTFLYSKTYWKNFTFGAVLEKSLFQYDAEYQRNTETTAHNENSRGDNYQFFLSYEVDLGENWELYSGIRPVWFSTLKTIPDMQQRLHLKWSPTNNTLINIGYARLIQDYHYSPTPGFSGNNDLIFPPSAQLPVARSKTIYLGWNQGVDFLNSTINSEIYWRTFNNLVDIRPGTSLLSPFESLNDVLVIGSGSSAGISMAIEGASKKLKWNSNITLSKTYRLFEERNNGRKYSFKYDRPVIWQLDLRYELNEQWTLNSAFTLSSGHLITNPTGIQVGVVYPPEPQTGIKHGYEIVRGINSYRLPLYHRLDVGASFKSNSEKMPSISFGAFNIYNRLNPQDYRYMGRVANTIRFNVIYLFPITPYITLKWMI